MKYMKGEITEKIDWLQVDSVKRGTAWVMAERGPIWYVPKDVSVPGHFINPEMLNSIAQSLSIPANDMDYITLVSGYGSRLSQSGYLACGEWAVFKTMREACAWIRAYDGKLKDLCTARAISE